MIWVPSIIAALSALFGAFQTPIQEWVSSHPVASIILAGISGIVAHLLPSPLKK